MTDLNAMVLFARVVELGGFSKAARTLGVQTSLLSRAVAQLEADLGVRLLNRTTRRMSVTDIGQTYYLHCAALAAEAEAAREVIEQTRSTPRGLVRISCPVPLLATGVSAVVTRFLREHPDVRLQVEATGRRVNLVEEGIDIAIRVRPLPLEDANHAIRPLAHATTRLVAHRRLLEGHGAIERPADLAGLPTVDMTSTLERHSWPFAREGGLSETFSHLPRLMTDDFDTLRAAVLDGSGVALMPSYVVRDDIATGRLVHLLPQWCTTRSLLHAAFPSRRGLVPAVRLLLDALVTQFEGTDDTI